jgi:DNA repair photolyase
MNLEFQEYRARKIVNVYKHVDGPWFWNKYSAHPYIGCRSGCEFCYLRGGRYLGRRDPATFDTLIQVKTNAVELLRRDLENLPRDILLCGDWQQPAEDKYRLSRAMLEVVYELGFPLFIVERSPLLARDLDLLQAIHEKTHVSVVLSFSNVDNTLKHAFEPRSPGIQRRLETMEQLAKAGILVGASLMPILPYVGDDEQHLTEEIQAARDHGGTFVLAGSLSMEGVQAERTFAAAQKLDPALGDKWHKFYKTSAEGKPNYSAPPAYHARLGLRVRELCERIGIGARMPRYVMDGPLAVNKRIAEQFYLKTYDLELEMAHAPANSYRIWAYRKAAWALDDLQESVATIHETRGEAGVRAAVGVGAGLAGEIVNWLQLQASIRH